MSLGKRVAIVVSIVTFVLMGTSAGTGNKKADHDWAIYGGTSNNNRYSPLTQINRKNVKNLHIAWTFDTEESGGLQTHPLEVNGVLYGLTPSQKVFALDAATGVQTKVNAWFDNNRSVKVVQREMFTAPCPGATEFGSIAITIAIHYSQ